MSHKVNAEVFRLGVSRFWKSELFSNHFSSFIQKFLAVYLLLKKKLNSFFFKVVLFKVVFLKKHRVLVLMDVYRLLRPVSNFNGRLLSPIAVRRQRGLTPKPLPNLSVVLRPVVKKSSVGHPTDDLKTLVSYKRYGRYKPDPEVVRARLRLENSIFVRKNLFPTSWLKVKLFSFRVERFVSDTLLFPFDLRLKNVFSPKRSLELSVTHLSLASKSVYRSVKGFWKLKNFLFLKDSINILSLSIFYGKSDLLSQYLSEIVRLRHKFLFEIRKIKTLLPFFNHLYFSRHGASLKINVLGKMLGQRRRRFRSFSMSAGFYFSTQDSQADLSYSLTQSWNHFGSFGIKVWIYRTKPYSGQ